jgi:isoleucyl-tRNA synthetase
MSGTAQTAPAPLTPFERESILRAIRLAEWLLSVEEPQHIVATIARLKNDSSKLIASYREQAEAQARANMQSALDAAGSKAKSILEEAEAKRTDLLKKAQAEAARIVADAQKAGEALTKKYAAAHEAAQSKLR